MMSITCATSTHVKLLMSIELLVSFDVLKKQVSKEFTKRDGSKVVNWKDMKECDIEYGWQFKGFEDEDVKVAERCACTQVRVRDCLC